MRGSAGTRPCWVSRNRGAGIASLQTTVRNLLARCVSGSQRDRTFAAHCATQTTGQKRSQPTRSKLQRKRAREWQLSGELSEPRGGSTRPSAVVHGRQLRGGPNSITAIAGTYHAFDFANYAHRYLAEFQFRFSHRFDMKTILHTLLT